MHRNTKIATCCYCGSRTVLRLDGARHELCCAQCGAPLHALKKLPVAATADVAGGKRSSDKRSSHEDFLEASDSRRKPRKEAAPTRYKESKRKKRKKRKPLFHKVFEEVADLIEDVFD